MSNYSKGFNKVLDLSGIVKEASGDSFQVMMDPSPKSYGVQGKRNDENLLPLASVHNLPSAMAVGVTLGGAAGAVTGDSPRGHYRHWKQHGAEKTLNRAKQHAADFTGYDYLKKNSPQEIYNTVRRQGTDETLRNLSKHLGGMSKELASKTGRGALAGALGAGALQALSNVGSYSANYVLAPEG